MDSRSHHLGVADANVEKGCSFLEILPLEVRETIYKYVIMVKVEQNMNSYEVCTPDQRLMYLLTLADLQYNMNRYELMGSQGAEHSYRFNTSILYANRQISHEASETFKRERLFVSVTARSSLLHRLEDYGLPVIARGDRAHKFPNVAMELMFRDDDPFEGWWPWGENPDDDLPLYFVLASDDISAFCTSLLRLMRGPGNTDRYQPRRITIDPLVNHSLPGAKDDCLFPHPRLGQLLNPLRQLHSMKSVGISGAVNDLYRKEIIDSMCAPPDSAQETMNKVSQAIDQGDSASESDLPLAVLKYKTGLGAILCSDLDDPEEVEVPQSGSRALRLYSEAVPAFEILLQTRLATSYLEMGKLRLARTYAERAYGPRYNYGQGYHISKLHLRVEPFEKPLYAPVMLIAARISYLQNDLGKAGRELEEAIRLGLTDDLAQRLLAQIGERREELRQKRVRKQQGRDRQRQIQDEKANYAYQVALDRRSKGHEAFRRGEFLKAISKYKAAIAKTEALRDMPEEYALLLRDGSLPWDEPSDGLPLGLRARIASTYLRLQAYKEASTWADAALKNDTTDDELWARSPWLVFAPPHQQTAYWCKAVALEKIGRFDGAVWIMQRALDCDPGDAHVLHRLAALKKAQEEQEARMLSKPKEEDAGEGH